MKTLNLLFASLYSAIPLMAIYALAIAVATFIENDYGTNAARVLVYNTWFFNFLHLWLLISLCGILVRYKLWQRKKYASFLLHLSFVIIILGAGITRFFGVEGIMHIREGESASSFTSSEIYLNMLVISDGRKFEISLPTNISYVSKKMLNEKIAFGDLAFVIKSTAITKLNSEKNDTTSKMDGAIFYQNKEYPFTLIGGGMSGKDAVISLDDGTNIIVNWGSKDVDLGFEIALEKFILERYPGSNSPSSYKSIVFLRDGGAEKKYEIFMNNVMDYRGYRFFQSSYDTDEKGTILSVNNDPGKIPTYVGYFLLFLSSFWLLFAKNGRFMQLNNFLKNQKIYGILFLCAMIFSQNLVADSAKNLDSAVDSAKKLDSAVDSANQTKIAESTQNSALLKRIEAFRATSKLHAKKFGTLQVQSNDGKIKTMDTLASDLVHKLTKRNNFLGFSNTQIALGMLLYPNDWKNIKMLRISTPQLRELLGLPKNEKYASFMDFFAESKNAESAPKIAESAKIAESSEYKLKNYIEEATRKNPANRSKFDNDIIDADERVNIAYGIYSSQFFRFLPVPQMGEMWISPIEMLTFAGEDLGGKIQLLLSNYFSAVEFGVESGDWSRADSALDAIEAYQVEFSAPNLRLSKAKLKAELFLNKSNIFKALILPYLCAGVLIFIAIFIYIFRQNERLKAVLKVLYYFSCVLILTHFAALILRWYVSNHAPWSNAYESMLYIAFISGVAGVVFFKKSYLAIAAANFFAGMSLFVANLGFMNPQITNLMPVLKSYWLNIHVSVITASYGFLGLCFLLGIITLCLIIANAYLRQKLDSTINSISAINEMAMILGIFLLSAGTFLGGIWANESWGRYWGWDAKETWSLVSIGVYAIILHLRLIFRKNMQFIFASASVVGFFSLLMTYFGVNYYLSGLHSYAAGDPLPIPKFLYFMVAFVFILIIIAFNKRKMDSCI
ncbi:cytochrome c biogenesis protein CcsA [Helicobacter sp. 23-1045]